MKNILITGASSGIGKALAEAYAGQETNLILIARNVDKLKEVAKICEQKGASVKSKQLDITDTEKTRVFINECDRATPLDLVIANAGISAGTASHIGVVCEPEEQVRKIFDTNLNGVLNTILPAINLMKERKKGQVAIMSSLASFRGLPSAPSYSASKAAVRFFGEGLRGVLKKDGIGLTVICPGYIKTPMTDANDFPMPFLMSAEKCAGIMKKKLAKNPARIAFPLPVYLVISLFGALPPRLTDWIFERLPGKKGS